MHRVLFAVLSLCFFSHICIARTIEINDINDTLSRSEEAQLLQVIKREIAFHEQYMPIPDQLVVDIRLFRHQSAYMKYQHDVVGHHVSKTAYFSHIRNEIVLWEVPHFMSVLYHEMQHLILASVLGQNAPVWLNEGVSDYYTQAVLRGDKTYVAVHVAFTRKVMSLIEQKVLPNWEEFFGLSKTEWNQVNQVRDGVTRALSWAVAYFLMSSRKGRDAIGATMTKIYRDKNRQFLPVYPGGLEAFDRDFRRFFASPALYQEI